MAKSASELIAALDLLKARHAEATQKKAVADSTYAQAQRAREKADAELRALGIDPEHAEATLVEEARRLEQEIAEVDHALTAALAQYDTIQAEFLKVAGL